MNRTILILLILALGSGAWLGFENWRIKNHAQEEVLRPKFGGTYYRAILDLPTTMDPAFVTDTTSAELVAQLYSRLLRMNVDMEVTNDLIRQMKVSDDKKIYSFELKEKVRFHTVTGDGQLSANRGRELVAEDVKYSMERLLNPAVNSPHRDLLRVVEGADEFADSLAHEVSGIRVLGRHKLEIRLKNPFSPFLSILTTPPLSIVAKEDVEKHGASFKDNPVGSGSFIFDSLEPAKSLVLRSNLDYFRGRPYLDKLVFRVMPSDLRQYEEFRAGRIHHVTHMPAHRLKDAIKEGRYKFKETSSLETAYLGMNVETPPFNNKDVRKALNYAINKKLLVRYIKNNHGMVAKGPLPPEVPGYTHGVEPYPFLLRKAREHLLKAGYQFDSQGLVIDFPEIVLQTALSEDTRAAAAAVQANLADLGVKLSLKFVSIGDHWQSVDAGTAPLFSAAWIADYPDADAVLYYNFHSRNKGISNSARYHNPEVDDLLVRARETGDSIQRNRLYNQVERIIVDDAPWIFLYYPTTYFLMQKSVHGLEICAFGGSEVDYYHVWLSDLR